MFFIPEYVKPFWTRDVHTGWAMILNRFIFRLSFHGSNGTPLQYSCLENPVDRGTWWATVHGVAKSWTGHDRATNTFTSLS